MKTEVTRTKSSEKVIIKKCHCCGYLMESYKEAQKCSSCKKSFLPSNYFGKIHAQKSEEFTELFLSSEDLHEDDLIKGFNVIW